MVVLWDVLRAGTARAPFKSSRHFRVRNHSNPANPHTSNPLTAHAPASG